MPLYVGLDSSTQSLTAIVIEVSAGRRRAVLEQHLSFDETLPSYSTRHGALPSDNPRVATAPPLMWAEALDRMMEQIARSGLNLADIRAIAGSAQQHGSVYLHAGAAATLARLDAAQPLVDQIRPIFSRAVSPIWMDTSTTDECEAITAATGGPSALAALTGSRAFERFTGPQIRKFAREEPAAYARTDRVHLVSSFLASLLAGRHAPLEPGDASGMNLMDIRTCRWAPAALRATAEELESKLPDIQPSWTIVGRLAAYWQQRYGFPACDVVAWSGDNPCSLVGVGLVREGRLAISLGTSDTVFGFMQEPRIDGSGAGHVFGSPTGGYMGLTCFKNGSLARERIRDAYRLDWAQFSDALRRSPPGSHGNAIMLPWFEPEITPPVHDVGVRRFDLDPTDASANVRAVIEAQAMAMERHSAWMGVHVNTIVATGGAAVNPDILQVIADVFGAAVERIGIANSAALGAALRAYHAAETARGASITWDEVVADFTPVPGSRVRPRAEYRATYDRLMSRHATREREALD